MLHLLQGWQIWESRLSAAASALMLHEGLYDVRLKGPTYAQRSAGSDEAINNCQGEISKIEADWPDDRLVAAYNGTEKRVGEPEADALLAEIKHRGLSL